MLFFETPVTPSLPGKFFFQIPKTLRLDFPLYLDPLSAKGLETISLFVPRCPSLFLIWVLGPPLSPQVALLWSPELMVTSVNSQNQERTTGSLTTNTDSLSLTLCEAWSFSCVLWKLFTCRHRYKPSILLLHYATNLKCSFSSLQKYNHPSFTFSQFIPAMEVSSATTA